MCAETVSLEELEQLATEKSSEKRLELLHRITDLFFTTEDRQKESDTDLFGQVMDHIAYNLETHARQELSERLADASKPPNKLLLKLATDDIDVARPVLERSESLTAEDLVTIAKSHSQDHLLAIACRLVLATEVTNVLVERGNDRVLTRVAENEGASFSDYGFATLSDRSKNNDNLAEILTKREDTPEELLAELKERVAKRLNEKISDTHDDNTKKKIEGILNAETSELANELSGSIKNHEDIEALKRHGLLDENILLKYAHDHRLIETIHTLAVLTKLDENMVRHCLLEADLPALAVLCKAYDYSRETFAALLQLRVIELKLPSKLAISGMKRYDLLTPETAKRIFRFLKVRLAAAAEENRADAS